MPTVTAQSRRSSATSGLGAKRTLSSHSLFSATTDSGKGADGKGRAVRSPLTSGAPRSPPLPQPQQRGGGGAERLGVRQEHIASYYHSPSTAKRLVASWSSPSSPSEASGLGYQRSLSAQGHNQQRYNFSAPSSAAAAIARVRQRLNLVAASPNNTSPAEGDGKATLAPAQRARLEELHTAYCQTVAERGPSDWEAVSDLLAKIDPEMLDANAQMARLRRCGFNPLRCPVLSIDILTRYALLSSGMAASPLPRDEQETLDAFVCLGGEPNRGGYIATDTLRAILSSFNLLLDVQAVLDEVDTDGSGTVEYEEFEAFYLKSKRLAAEADARRKRRLSGNATAEDDAHDDNEDANGRHQMAAGGNSSIFGGGSANEDAVARTLSMTSVEAFELLSRMLMNGGEGLEDEWEVLGANAERRRREEEEAARADPRYILDDDGEDGGDAEGGGSPGSPLARARVAFSLHSPPPFSAAGDSSTGTAPFSFGPQSGASNAPATALMMHSSAALGSGADLTATATRIYDGNASPGTSAFKSTAAPNAGGDAASPTIPSVAVGGEGFSPNPHQQFALFSAEQSNGSFALSFAGAGSSFAGSPSFANAAGLSFASSAGASPGTSLRTLGGVGGRRARSTVVRREKTAAAILSDKLNAALEAHSNQLRDVDRRHNRAPANVERFAHHAEVDHVTELAHASIERQRVRSAAQQREQEAFDARVHMRRIGAGGAGCAWGEGGGPQQQQPDFGVAAWHSAAAARRHTVNGPPLNANSKLNTLPPSQAHHPPPRPSRPTSASAGEGKGGSAPPSPQRQQQQQPQRRPLSATSAASGPAEIPNYARPTASTPFGPPSSSGTASLIALMRARVAAKEAHAKGRDAARHIARAGSKVEALGDRIAAGPQQTSRSDGDHRTAAAENNDERRRRSPSVVHRESKSLTASWRGGHGGSVLSKHAAETTNSALAQQPPVSAAETIEQHTPQERQLPARRGASAGRAARPAPLSRQSLSGGGGGDAYEDEIAEDTADSDDGGSGDDEGADNGKGCTPSAAGTRRPAEATGAARPTSAVPAFRDLIAHRPPSASSKGKIASASGNEQKPSSTTRPETAPTLRADRHRVARQQQMRQHHSHAHHSGGGHVYVRGGEGARGGQWSEPVPAAARSASHNDEPTPFTRVSAFAGRDFYSKFASVAPLSARRSAALAAAAGAALGGSSAEGEAKGAAPRVPSKPTSRPPSAPVRRTSV